MIRQKKKKQLIYAVATFAAVLLLEIFIFNYQFFITPGNGEYTSIRISDISYSGLEEYNAGYRNTGNRVTLELKDINAPVKTVGLHLTFINGYKASYSIDFADDSNSSYRIRSGMAKGDVVDLSQKSEIVYIQTSGDVHMLKVNLSLPENTDIFISDGEISLNEKVPFSFSILRVLAVLAVVYSFMFFSHSVMCKKSISEIPSVVNSSTAIICIACAAISLLLSAPSSKGFTQDFSLTTGDQMTKELVEAFEHGQLHLLREVEPELLELENPYDWSQRLESGVSYAWDHVMYEGKYYSYYGIAPVILLFLPYHLLTGYYFPSVWAVFLFGALGLVFLCLAYKSFIKRIFPNVRYGMYLSGLITTVASCGIWFCYMTPQFYEIAQTSGFLFVTLGAYLLFNSGVLDKGKVSYVSLAFSAVSFAAAVLCRPTTAVWCIAAVVFIIYGFVRRYRELTKTKKAAYIICSAVPFAVIGGIQMLYNYMRFGSPVDFGIQYSLTINDFTVSEFSPNMAFIGFYNYLFAVPIINDIFPFIHSNFSDLNINGYYFIANQTSIGIFFRALPTLGIFAVPKLLSGKDRKKYIFPGAIWLLCVVLLPCIVIYSIWESGYGVRYCVDFSWQIVLGALTVLFVLCEQKKHLTALFTGFSLCLL